MRAELSTLALSGFAMALIEVVHALVLGRGLFLTFGERLQYAITALCAGAGFTLLSGLVLRPALERRSWRVGFALAFSVAGGACALLLTSGRRVHELWFRPLLVLAFALMVGATGYALLAWIGRLRGREPQTRTRWAMSAIPLVVVVLVLDQRVLPNAYPAFHGALTMVALVLSAVAGLTLPALPLSERAQRLVLVVVLSMSVVAPWLVMRLNAHPNASYVVERTAPWSKKVLALAGRLSTSAPVGAPAPDVVTPRESEGSKAIAPGIDLRDRDVLLITVDALRADMLRAYGGSGVTPELDELAAESVVFRRAYTPAPHTSYALSSLLTAKYLKPVFEIPGAVVDHPTLPDLLRRYGYRTSAFYPPAIFFVDGARFDTLRERGFGFEYRKEMFASASQRVTQLEEYLRMAEPGHPLFTWIHLFEPHEPYDPPEGLASDDSARGRYEGEVRAADRAIAELVRVFRAARAGATVIVTADHGEEFGDHGGQFHGSSLFDEQVRVPLLWSSPEAHARVVDVPVDLTDIGATLLSAAGVPREARMRGDDLSGTLAGDDEAAPKYTFASIEDRHMASDGAFKLVCGAHDAHCRLFDLVGDPKELRDLRVERPAELARLRGALDAFLSSIPRVEAIAVAEGASWPEPLARARLNAPGAGPDVVPLLSDARARVRRAAARVLGELHVAQASSALERLRRFDPDPDVRAECAIAALSLGASEARDDVIALLEREGTDDGLSLARRAALALANQGELAGVAVLSALAADEHADEVDRVRAIEALGQLRAKEAVPELLSLLESVRFRVVVAEALAAIGDKRAVPVLLTRLRNEPYPPARGAQARALVALGARQVVPIVTYLLGMETSVPLGVQVLVDMRALDRPSARGARLSDARVRRGAWTCNDRGCAPGADAKVTLPSTGLGRGAVRVTWLVAGKPGATVNIDGVRYALKSELDQISLVRDDASKAHSFSVASDEGVQWRAVAVTKASAEIPPPPPEPWQSDEVQKADEAGSAVPAPQ